MAENQDTNFTIPEGVLRCFGRRSKEETEQIKTKQPTANLSEIQDNGQRICELTVRDSGDI
jgi:hypothetical protein